MLSKLNNYHKKNLTSKYECKKSDMTNYNLRTCEEATQIE